MKLRVPNMFRMDNLLNIPPAKVENLDNWIRRKADYRLMTKFIPR